MARKKAQIVANKFDNRTRFNWGYHNAAQAIRKGWDNPEHNFGFSSYGPLAGLTCPADVLNKHFDQSYAQGWWFGYMNATEGKYAQNSQEAWDNALKLGLVTL